MTKVLKTIKTVRRGMQDRLIMAKAGNPVTRT